MRTPFVSAWLGLLAVCASAATGPLRVLYLDAPGAEQTAKGNLHELMAALGRDAIWFDYAAGETPSAATLERYDALVIRPRADGSPALNTSVKLPNGAQVEVFVAKEPLAPAAFAQDLAARLNAARVADWRKFAEQREPEVREESPWVANYEKRPKPLTLQKPYSVKGSMEPSACSARRRSTSAAMPSGAGMAVYQSFHNSPSRTASLRACT